MGYRPDRLEKVETMLEIKLAYQLIRRLIRFLKKLVGK